MPAYIVVATLHGANSPVANSEAADNILPFIIDADKEINCSFNFKYSIQQVRRMVLSILHAVSAVPDCLHGFDVKLRRDSLMLPLITDLDSDIVNLVHQPTITCMLFRISFQIEEDTSCPCPSMTFFVGDTHFKFALSSLGIFFTDKMMIPKLNGPTLKQEVENIQSPTQAPTLSTLGKILHHNMQQDNVVQRCDRLLEAIWPIVLAGPLSGLVRHTNANLQREADANIKLKLEFRTINDHEKNNLKERLNMAIERYTSGWSAEAEESARLPQRVAPIKGAQSCIQHWLQRLRHSVSGKFSVKMFGYTF
jgi:hypothetical protein